MSRRDRWWRPVSTSRPATRARRRAFSGREVDAAFSEGYEAGVAEQEKRDQHLRDSLDRVMRAIDEADNGDRAPLDELLVEVDGGQLVDELEAWLRGDA